MTYTAKSIANVFISLGQRDGTPVSNMKLQKLLYFAHALYLSATGRPLIGESPEAWQYGPVYSSVYHEFKNCGSAPITTLAMSMLPDRFEWAVAPPVDQTTLSFLESVWKTYGPLNAVALSALSHVPDGPWARVRRESYGSISADIPDSYIREYYAPQFAKARAG